MASGGITGKPICSERVLHTHKRQHLPRNLVARSWSTTVRVYPDNIMIPSYTACMFFRVYCKDDAAVVGTKSQGRNECFELDMCWSGFLVNISDDGPSVYVSLYDRMEGRCALSAQLAMRWRKP
jgi:hypothetical protein